MKEPCPEEGAVSYSMGRALWRTQAWSPVLEALL